MTALEAALRVLQDEGKPLHYREITSRILAGKLWQCSGKTPEATINAQLAVNIKKNGRASAFRRAGRGIFGLNTDWTEPAAQQKELCRTEDRALYVRGPQGAEKLSFTESAYRILEAGGGKPMHYGTCGGNAIP